MTQSAYEIHDIATLGLAAEVRAWMGRRGLRQVDIAQAIGVTQTQISARLRGQIPFTFEQLIKIAAVMDITLSELLGERILNEKHPRPAMRDEGDGQLPQLDSNQQPLDYQFRRSQILVAYFIAGIFHSVRRVAAMQSGTGTHP